MMKYENDTIVAIATPIGISALGIVRMSGPNIFFITQRIFFNLSSKKKIKEYNGHTLHYGEIRDNNRLIDEVVIGIMKSPHSYTGEDMIEITCHGNSIILNRILELCIKNGARIAEPGEFTKRAFLNGKMDLSQAESVNQLICSRTEKAAQEALKLLKGSLRNEVEEIKSIIMQVKVNLDVDIEWGETEELDIMDKSSMDSLLKKAQKRTAEILKNTHSQHQLMEGFKVVICGKTNAGKSSLFNCLLNTERSIINRLPGTTRNVIVSETVIDGYLIKFVDTAGIGIESESEIGRIAEFKSKEEIELADIVIYVIDGTTGLEKKDYSIKKLFEEKKCWIPVINKCDLKIIEDDIEEFCGNTKYYKISCKNKRGIAAVKNAIKKQLKNYETDKIMITNRQKEALKDIVAGVSAARRKLNSNGYYEIISYELQQGLNSLCKIDGSIIDADILKEIFNRFCIGK